MFAFLCVWGLFLHFLGGELVYNGGVNHKCVSVMWMAGSETSHIHHIYIETRCMQYLFMVRHGFLNTSKFTKTYVETKSNTHIFRFVPNSCGDRKFSYYKKCKYCYWFLISEVGNFFFILYFWAGGFYRTFQHFLIKKVRYATNWHMFSVLEFLTEIQPNALWKVFLFSFSSSHSLMWCQICVKKMQS